MRVPYDNSLKKVLVFLSITSVKQIDIDNNKNKLAKCKKKHKQARFCVQSS